MHSLGVRRVWESPSNATKTQTWKADDLIGFNLVLRMFLLRFFARTFYLENWFTSRRSETERTKKKKRKSFEIFHGVKVTNVAQFSHIAFHWLFITDWCARAGFLLHSQEVRKTAPSSPRVNTEKKSFFILIRFSVLPEYWAINSFFSRVIW